MREMSGHQIRAKKMSAASLKISSYMLQNISKHEIYHPINIHFAQKQQKDRKPGQFERFSRIFGRLVRRFLCRWNQVIGPGIPHQSA